MNASTKYQITAELLSALETERYQIGVGEQLQIQTLLQKLPDDSSVDDLKYALIPLLAKNKVDQDRLYALFDAIVKNVGDKEEGIGNREYVTRNKEEVEQTFWQAAFAVIQKNKIIIAGTVLVLLGIITAIIYLTRPPKQKDITDKIKVEQPNNIPTPTQTTPTQKQENPFVENKPYPFPNHLEDYSYKPPSKTQEWLQTNWQWARWIAAFAFCLLLFAFWQWLARRRSKLVAEQNQNDKPPYFWNINLEGVDKDLFDINSIEKVSTLLRHRSEADKFRMDIPKTIDATIAQGGSPIFVYKTETSPTDYVLLIDRQSVRNHRARLFDELYAVFKAQEVEIARFFYDSDVRVCFNESYPNGISISDIQQRHYTSRLILIGTGTQLLSPLSGKLAKWTEIFEQFRHRAILSPKPLKLWGYDEKQLSNLFTTLPATLEGLSFWLYQLDAGADARFDTWQNKIDDAPNAPIAPDEANPIPILQLYFNTDIIQWIAACAIYPTLHYDLTLWLGQQLSDKDKKLCTYSNLSQIFRLSWFVQGEIPKETRAALIDWFEQNTPEKLLQLRAALVIELSKNPPAKDSVAFEQFRMNVAVNEWLTTTDAQKKAALQAEIANQLASGVEPDFTVIKYLDKPRTRLDFLVPNQWKKFVHPAGYAQLGWLKEYSDLRWLLPVLLLGLVAIFWNYKFDSKICSKGDFVGFFNVNLELGQKKEYLFCNEDAFEEMVLNENIIDKWLTNNQSPEIDNFLKVENVFTKTPPISYLKELLSKKFGSDSIEVKMHLDSLQTILSQSRKNIAVELYRKAKYCFDSGSNDSVCYYLRGAILLDSTDIDIKKAQQIVCKDSTIKVKPIVSNITNGKQNATTSNSTNFEKIVLERKKLLGNRGSLEGIDISHFEFENGKMIDFDYVAENFAFVYAKATEGANKRDPKFIEIFQALSERNILRGAFHIFRFSKDVNGQINNFLNTGINYSQTGILPPVLTIEPEVGFNPSVENVNAYIAQLRTWLETIEQKTNKKPIIYTSKNMWDNILKSPTGFETYPLWVGSYTTGMKPVLPSGWKNYDIWQYTENGTVKGATGIDLNHANFTYDDLVNLARPRAKTVSQNTSRTDALNASQQTGNVNKSSLPNPINSLPQRNTNPESNTVDNTSLDNELNQLNELMRGADPKTANCYDASFKTGKAYYDKGNYELAAAQWKIALDCKNLPDGIRKVLNNLINKLNAKIQNKTIDFDMVFVQGGTFIMGNDDTKGDAQYDGKPAHKVTLSDFYIGKTEVTQAQWRAVMGSDPPELLFKGCDNCPFESVSWDDIQEFLKKLNAKSKNPYRLPTEAEWEYAARGGEKSKNYTYSGSNNLDEVAWQNTNSGDKTHAVATLKPNELGIYDMSGNVWEWCSDLYDQNYYKNSPAQNPQGPAKGNTRVVRGGSWDFLSTYCRVAYRNRYNPASRISNLGFRVARYK